LTVKKVLLLNPPAPQRVSRDYYCGHITKGKYYWPPLDLLVLSGFLRGGFEVRVLDAMVTGEGVPETLRAVDDFGPHAVICMTSAISWTSDVELLGLVKQRSGSMIVVSGDYARAKPSAVLHGHPSLDAVVLDFADSQIVDLLEGASGPGLRNISTRLDSDSSARATERRFSLPLPQHELFDLRRYHLPHIRHHPFTMLMTDYGCPFDCAFCYLERVGYRRRETDNIAQELEFIRSLGIRELLLTDASFGSVKPHALDVCRLMKEVGGRFSWVCDMRVDAAEEDLLFAMKEAGCHTIMFGVETPNEEVLEKHKKRIDAGQIEMAFRTAKRVGLRTLAHFMLGLSGENAASLERLIDFSLTLDPDIASFNVAAPAWNTSFREEVVQEKWLLESGVGIANADSLPVWESPAIERRRLIEIRDRALRRFYMRPSYMLRQLLSVRTPYQFRILLREGAHMIWQCGASLAAGSHRLRSNVSGDEPASGMTT
jgi:radical SAM superfamily enzyme YgiQ (UPF0313 family)